MVYIVRFLLPVVMFIGLLPIQAQAQKNTSFIPGEVWKDTDGNPINAHGGGLLYHEGTYYWYGEYKKRKNDITGMGYMGMLSYRCDGSRLLFFQRFTELEI